CSGRNRRPTCTGLLLPPDHSAKRRPTRCPRLRMSVWFCPSDNRLPAAIPGRRDPEGRLGQETQPAVIGPATHIDGSGGSEGCRSFVAFAKRADHGLAAHRLSWKL